MDQIIDYLDWMQSRWILWTGFSGRNIEAPRGNAPAVSEIVNLSKFAVSLAYAWKTWHCIRKFFFEELNKKHKDKYKGVFWNQEQLFGNYAPTARSIQNHLSGSANARCN